MTPVIIDAIELNNILYGFMDGDHWQYTGRTKTVFLTLAQFGFRCTELKNCHLWEYDSNGMIVATTAKWGSNRLLDPIRCEPDLLYSIATRTNYVYMDSYRTYDRIFQQHVPVTSMTVGKKQLSTHAFRHLKIKELYNQNKTPEEIQTYMGIKKVETVLQYINSQINVIY